MSKILKNQGSDLPIPDTGVTLPASPSTYTITPADYALWGKSADILPHIASSAVIVDDGYGDLDPTLAVKHLQEEGIPRSASLIVAPTITVTSASDLTLTSSSMLFHIFTGTTAGQGLKLPDATTILPGYRYEIWNTSTQSVLIKNSAGTSLFTLASFQKTTAVLQINTPAAGTWLFEANFLGGTGSGNGTLTLGFDGNASTGRWLETITNNPSNVSPYVIAGQKAIRALSISTSGNSTQTVTVFKNGVALETLATAAQSVNSKLNLNHVLVDKDKISAKVTSGSSAKPTLLCWL